MAQIFRCFWCDRTSANEALFRISRKGYLKCVECCHHDDRIVERILTHV